MIRQGSRLSVIPSRASIIRNRASATSIRKRPRYGFPERDPRPPMGPSYNFTDTLGKRCLTTAEMNRIQMCCPCPGEQPYIPQCICVQQTPRIVCRKNILWVQKVKQEPTVVNSTRVVMVPRVVKVAKAIRIPEVTWTEGYVKVPKIDYRKTNVTTYDVKQTCKEILGPQEICTSFLCRPKPQYILIPPPTDYCCYPIDALNDMQITRPQLETNPYKLAFKSPEYVGPAFPIIPPQSSSFSQNFPISPFFQNYPIHPINNTGLNTYPNYSYGRNSSYYNPPYSTYGCGFFGNRSSKLNAFGPSMGGYPPPTPVPFIA